MKRIGGSLWAPVIIVTTLGFYGFMYEPWFQAIGMVVFFGFALYGALLWATDPLRRN